MRCTSLASVAIVGLLLPALAHAQQLGRDDATFTWSRDLSAGARVSVRNGDGPITVREGTGNRVEVRATKTARGRSSIRDVSFDVHLSGGDVEICTLYGDQTSCGDRNRGSRNNDSRVQVEYTVLVPRTMRVSVATGNGNVNVEHAGADLVASSGNGKIDIGDAAGGVDASTGNGPITIESANGQVNAKSGNGRISVTAAHGSVRASTGNGDIDVRLTSVNADAADMSFTSGSGALRVTLPADFNGRVDATTGSGSLTSDFEIGVVGRLDAHHIRGTIGRGGPLVRLSTGSGRIELRKR